jgi:hypothetical protein
MRMANDGQIRIVAGPTVLGVLGLATAGRNFGAALVPAASSFNDPKVTIMIVVGAIVCPFVLFLAAGARPSRNYWGAWRAPTQQAI